MFSSFFSKWVDYATSFCGRFSFIFLKKPLKIAQSNVRHFADIAAVLQPIRFQHHLSDFFEIYKVIVFVGVVYHLWLFSFLNSYEHNCLFFYWKTDTPSQLKNLKRIINFFQMAIMKILESLDARTFLKIFNPLYQLKWIL